MKYFLLFILSFCILSCAKKKGKPEPNTQTITVSAKSYCNNGMMQIDWDASQCRSSGIGIDSTYKLQTNAKSFSKILSCDSIKISVESISDVDILVDDVKIKTINCAGGWIAYFIKVQ